MIFLSGYQIYGVINEDINSSVYYGIREYDQTKVIIKIYKQDYPSTFQLNQYQQEYNITKSLHSNGVLKVYNLEKYNNGFALILEYFDGKSLKVLLNEYSFSLREFLEIAIKIVTTLEEIHIANIIHKNINSYNIFYDINTKQLKITNFAVASVLTREKYQDKFREEDLDILESTLAYISPEQTGRIGKKLDYRTDFYSLGIILYELLTGMLPFNSEDSLNLFYCHIAKIPTNPSLINPSIPVIISDIIIKLMAKNLHERYQSAWGLKKDLNNCLQQLNLTEIIDSFPLAREDISDKFLISNKIYNREENSQILLNKWNNISNQCQTEIIFIIGNSGIGKSSLVEEVYTQINENKSYFISGKFDQFHQSNPYNVLINTFQKLVKQKLKENQENIDNWKNQLLKNLGINAQVIIDIIPDIKLIIGEQLPVVELNSYETETRFNLVFQNFMKCCCTKENPLVIFLDDLQWADDATLKLMELIILNNNLPHLLFIGAYRDNEVNDNHALTMMMNNIKKHQGIINTIHLQDLTINHISDLIADTLHCDIEEVKLLSKLVLKKTKGNPFFIKQFLQTLYFKKLINFDYHQYKWRWDIKNISAQNITDNVVKLMVNQLIFLPKYLQFFIQLCACIGNKFNLSTLLIIYEKPSEKILEELRILIDYGLIVSVSSEEEINNYQFLHDRVQQVAYNLINDQEKSKIHLTIGKLLFTTYNDIEKEEHLFDIVEHWNKGKNLINSFEEKENLIKLNLKVVKKAKKSIAYDMAKVYLEHSIELLDINYWHHQYDLSLKLYTLSAEIAYLIGNYQEMQIMAQKVLDNARNIIDKIVIYKIFIGVEIANSNMSLAIDIGRKALKELSIELPTSPTSFDINNALQHLNNQLENRNIEDLIKLPINRNAEGEAILEILAMLYPSFFQSMPNILPWVSATMVSLSIKFGNLRHSAIGYCIHGMALCSFLSEVKKGYSFGKLAMDLIDIDSKQKFQGLSLQIFGCIIQCRSEPIRNSLITLKKSYEITLETGDLINVGYNSLVYCFTAFFAGMELKTLETELINYYESLTVIRQDSAKTYLEMTWQTIKNLQETSPQPHLLIGELYDETIKIEQHLSHQELTAIAQVYIYKLLLAYHFGEYQWAQYYINQAQPYLSALGGIVFVPYYYYYTGLTYGALWENQDNQDETIEKIEYYQAILSYWAEDTPVNYKSKWHLVEAEKYRILNDKAKAIEHYDKAIELAKKNEFINEVALANELAGKFYLSWEKEKLAQFYFQESLYYYNLWGATAKVANFQQAYSRFLSPITTSSNSSVDTNKTTNGNNSRHNLDLITLVKASQAIATDIELESLLQTLMNILIENAGVQTGCLLLHNGDTSEELDTFTIAINTRDNHHFLYPDKTIAQVMPESIFHYVVRSKEVICLDYPYLTGDFTDDSYIQSVQPFSILCYPLINQGSLLGIVYLENNLTTGACNIQSVEVLQILSGQCAIAIKNAQLYNQVKHSQKLLTQFLEAIPVGIGVLDSNGHPYYLNDKAKSILGKRIIPQTNKEDISKIYNIYVSGTNQIYPNENLPVIKALEGEISSADDMEIHQNNQVIPIESWATPIYDETGKILYAMVAFQDITPRKAMEKTLKDYNLSLKQEVYARTKELLKANKQLSHLANLDGLTKIANRRRFDEYLKQQWQRHLRQQQFLSLILIDIDYFKLYNDFYKHQMGDDCLIRVAQTISNVIKRPTDLFARYGGEEFAVILPETSPQGAFKVAQLIQNAISQLQIPHEKSLINSYVTLSIGIASIIPTSQLTMENFIKQSDESLYQAKHEGRNRIISNSLES